MYLLTLLVLILVFKDANPQETEFKKNMISKKHEALLDMHKPCSSELEEEAGRLMLVREPFTTEKMIIAERRFIDRINTLAGGICNIDKGLICKVRTIKTKRSDELDIKEYMKRMDNPEHEDGHGTLLKRGVDTYLT